MRPFTRTALLLALIAPAALAMTACESSPSEGGAIVLTEERTQPDLDEELPEVDDDPETPRNEASVTNRRRVRDTDDAADDPETPQREDAARR